MIFFVIEVMSNDLGLVYCGTSYYIALAYRSFEIDVVSFIEFRAIIDETREAPFRSLAELNRLFICIYLA